MARIRTFLATAALALSVVVAAVAVPTAAVPARVAVAPHLALAPAAAAAAAAAHPVAALLRPAVSRQLSLGHLTEEEVTEVLQEALAPMWDAFTSGSLDGLLADFQAGKLDDVIPSKADVLTAVDEIVALVKRGIPIVYELLEQLKAGEFDDFLADAKSGTLEEFVDAVVAHVKQAWLASAPRQAAAV